MAEIDLDSEKPFQLPVMVQQDIVVGSDCLHFGIQSSDPLERLGDIRNRQREYFLKERCPEFPIHHSQNPSPAGLSRFQEVCFCVSHSSPKIRDPRPVLYKFPVSQFSEARALSPPLMLFPETLSIGLNPSSMNALQKADD